jgi:tRNA-2-methylthio-N6-dimethylallyladenosine synthase
MFAALLRAVGEVDGIRRVRFTSPHPKDIRPETIQAMSDTDAVCNQLHLPLQSGSDAVLKAMRRGYTAERYLQRLADARRGIEDLAVTTDLIVGFPGETDDDAERTLEVVAEARFDSAYTFIFSPRPGTRAATMPDKFVPPEVVADRFDRLKVVLERSALARHAERVGHVEELLVEGTSKRDPDVLSGRTRQGKLLHFPVPPGEQIAAGSYARAIVTGAAPHFLRGELLELTALPNHSMPRNKPPGDNSSGSRLRIPVRSVSGLPVGVHAVAP